MKRHWTLLLNNNQQEQSQAALKDKLGKTLEGFGLTSYPSAKRK